MSSITSACGSGSGGPDGGVADGGAPDADLPDAWTIPKLWNNVELPDTELATEALKLLGSIALGGTKNCGACHGLTVQNLRQWRAMTDDALSMCLTDLDVESPASAQTMIDCLREDINDTGSPFQPHKTGVFASAAHLDWFDYTFQQAYGEADYQDELDEFINRLGMPKGAGTPYTQPQLDIVATWFTRGLPQIEAVLPNDPPPTECTPGISADIAAHVAQMQMSGWGAFNEENNILMYGCGGAATPLDCLSSYPRSGDEVFSENWEVVAGSKIRILKEIGWLSNFWTRSSADGRFVASGGDSGLGGNSWIVDLQNDTTIPTNAYYDPAFFPDNSGFVFQGWRAFMCEQSLLGSEPSGINYQEDECNWTQRIGLYEQVGAVLGGGDYWAVDSQFVSDNGGHAPNLNDPAAAFDSQAEVSFTPIIHTGSGFSTMTSINVDTRFEGDVVLSPSSQLIVTRVAGPGDNQLGYVVRKVIATPDSTSYTIETPEIARYCFNGGKPAFSFDERWMVIHHYVGADDAVDLGFTGPSDPGFADYLTKGAANSYLLDMLTGEVTRITNMKPGQYALFPHFRSDGWIYIQLRTAEASGEHILATDAALVLEAGE